MTSTFLTINGPQEIQSRAGHDSMTDCRLTKGSCDAICEIMKGKIMKTKALASYDQLRLATKRGSDYGPVPNLLNGPVALFRVQLVPRPQFLTQRLNDLCVSRIVREVFQLARIRVVVVKLGPLLAAVPFGVAIAFGAH